MKNEKIEPEMKKQQKIRQTAETVMTGCMYLAIYSATVTAINGVQLEVYDLQRHNPYDYFNIAGFVTSQKGYMETQKNIDNIASDLYVTQPKNLVYPEDRPSIYEMLEACSNEETKQDVVKLMTVLAKNENLNMHDMEGYMMTIPFLIDMLNLNIFDKHDLADYFANQVSTYDEQKARHANYNEDQLFYQTKREIARNLVKQVLSPYQSSEAAMPEKLVNQVEAAVYLEYFSPSPFFERFSCDLDELYADTRMSYVLTDLLPSDVVLKAVASGDIELLRTQLFQICPDFRQIDTLLSTETPTQLLQAAEPFYEAKFQTPVNDIPILEYYAPNNSLDRYMPGPVMTTIVSPRYNTELKKTVGNPYIQLDYYDTYDGEKTLNIEEYQRLKNALFERFTKTLDEADQEIVQKGYTCRTLFTQRVDDIYSKEDEREPLTYRKTIV